MGKKSDLDVTSSSILYSSPPAFLPSHDMDWHAGTMHQVAQIGYQIENIEDRGQI